MRLKDRVTFMEKEHIYLLDGWCVLPSVTQILHFKFKDMYKDVPDEVLKKASNFGTKVHKLTEQIDNGEDINIDELPIYESFCCKQHLKLNLKHNIEHIESEKIVINEELGYIGTLDKIAYVNGEKSIIDKKCTSKFNKDYVSWQCSMYMYALEDKNIKKLYCEWLKKGDIGKLEELYIVDYEEIKKLVKEYYKCMEEI
jgi:hypothetical protein